MDYEKMKRESLPEHKGKRIKGPSKKQRAFLKNNNIPFPKDGSAALAFRVIEKFILNSKLAR